MSLFEAEDWDFTRVGATLSLSSLADKVVETMDKLSAKYDIRDTRKPWAEISRRLSLVKVRFERLLESKDQINSLTQPSAEAGEVDGMPFFMNQFDLLDEEFWQNLPIETEF